MVNDINHYKQAEEKCRESARKYRELFESSRDGFVIVDVKGRFIDANPAYCEMLGYTIDELRQKENFFEVTPQQPLFIKCCMHQTACL
jgi:PAS domain S-box-containing protein